MTRSLPLVLALVVAVGSAAQVRADEKEDAMKAWSSFVGEWKVTTLDGSTQKSSVVMSRSKTCFIHQTDEVTHVVGWDPAAKALKSTTYANDGGHAVAHWKLVGDGPKLEGELKIIDAEGDDAGTVSIKIAFSGKDRWEMKIGDGTVVAERVK